MNIQWTCPECEKETELRVYPIIPAKLYGPPENCHPEEGGEVEPEECQHCGHKIDQGLAYEQAVEKHNDERDAALEAKYEAQRTED